MFSPWRPFVGSLVAAASLCALSRPDLSQAEDALRFNVQSREPVASGGDRFLPTSRQVEWRPRETAIVVCDMWDRHWCRSATARVAEMAPRMNEVLRAARARGVTIFHCPSDTMQFYQDAPQRRPALEAARLSLPGRAAGWCPRASGQEPPLPWDNPHDRCDCEPPCPHGNPWRRQIATLEIADQDVITDNLDAFYLMKQRGIVNVIVMGVHTNMCVLGRPFSIRQMASVGQNVVLMRDMTDSIRDAQMPPAGLDHFRGTEMIVAHIEKYWCPTIVSSDFLGGPAFAFAADKRPHVVFLIGEDEYQTAQTLPEFAESELAPRGIRCTYLHASESDKDDFPQLEQLDAADLLVVSVRRRALPERQLERIRAYDASGRPIVGLRTASHAFALRDNAQPRPGHALWPEFDAEVLGGNYQGHHGVRADDQPNLPLSVEPAALDHAILSGVDASKLPTFGSLYKTRPLAATASVLLWGQAENGPPEPVAWTNLVGGRRAFYTSLGHPRDFASPAMRQLLTNAVFWALGRPVAQPADGQVSARENPRRVEGVAASGEGNGDRADAAAGSWTRLLVPGVWEQNPRFAQHDGFAWYRCAFRLRPHWQGQKLQLQVEQIDNSHEAYINGQSIGGAGRFPPDFANGLDQPGLYDVGAELLRADADNVLAIRIYDREGRGGFKGRAPSLWLGDEGMPLEGGWEFRPGDDLAWAREAPTLVDAYTYVMPRASLLAQARRFDEHAPPFPPARSAASHTTPDDLEATLVLAEPDIAQPLHLSFDERGRLWVVEYRQYPHPAGLKMLSRDNVWRAVYDRTPLPPPHHVRGADRITIHEDADGDGRFETHKTFVEGLNIATACQRGRGGVWVLNPPYLLFYPDRDGDDLPDGDPEVHLSGFGLEDTHSVVNSLCWGPDGWLYAAQGSTVSGDVVRPGRDKQPIHSLGQLIWRYQPEQRRYEIFAEGGGNAFGCEIDARGRVFSGHNGGDTRGFHYVQGGYSQKGFGKHGPLSNPYAFGYFSPMKHPTTPRFTHALLINEGDNLPAAYQGRLFGVAPLLTHVVISQIDRDGSTFRTQDVGLAMESSDSWFKPVDIKLGLDGALYVADWYDGQVNHYRNHEGQIDASNGRVYRLAARGSRPAPPENLASLSTAALIDRLQHPNRAQRFVALRLLGDRRDPSAIPLIRQRLASCRDERALDLLWGLHASGGFDETTALELLRHDDPYVRLWTVRLACDDGQASTALAAELAAAARRESHVEARSQMACSARRLAPTAMRPIVAALAMHSEDVDDPHLPLLIWWAVERHAEADRDALIEWFSQPEVAQAPLVERHLLARLMRRYAQSGARRDYDACAALLRRAPSAAATTRLMAGFEEAFAGRSLADVPDRLIEALARAGGGSLALRVRRGDRAAIDEALAQLKQRRLPAAELIALARLFGEAKHPDCIDVLIEAAAGAADEVRAAALAALGAYDEPRIGPAVSALLPSLGADSRSAALALLSSRPSWSGELLDAVERGEIAPAAIPQAIPRKLLVRADERTARRIAKLFGPIEGATTAEMRLEIERLSQIVRAATGDPYAGKKLFTRDCGKCHTLYGEGGQIGPDLTAYKRDDLETMLLNVVNPSAEIREGFEQYQVLTDDGRLLAGFLADQDAQVVTLRSAEGTSISVVRTAIEEMRRVPASIMPEGLLKAFSDQQVRDLFAYLRATQPQVLVAPRGAAALASRATARER